MALFYATIKCEITGITLLEDFECEIEAEVYDTYTLQINDVLAEGKSMFKGDEITKALASRIAAQAEDNEALHEHFGVKAWDTAAQRKELGTW